MQTFPIKQIRQQKKDLLAEGFPTIEVMFENTIYHCLVLPRAMAALRYFAFRMTPKTAKIKTSDNPDTITLFGVSDEVPARFRELWLLHEIAEFCGEGIESDCRCANATREELSYAQDTLSNGGSQRGKRRLRNYINLRLDFFRGLIDFAIRQRFDHEDLKQMVESKDLFEVALRTLRPRKT